MHEQTFDFGRILPLDGLSKWVYCVCSSARMLYTLHTILGGIVVNLSPEQVRLLADLEEVRLTYDGQARQIREQMDALNEEIKRPVREKVAAAERLNIPARQIHLALGFTQPGPFHTFMRPAKGTGGVEAPVFTFQPPVQAAPKLTEDTADTQDEPLEGSHFTSWERANGEQLLKGMVYRYLPQYGELWFRGVTTWEHKVTDEDEKIALDAAMSHYLTERFGVEFENVKKEK